VLGLFDYFLSATGEESDAVIRARIEAVIRERLDAPAEQEAIDLLDKYIAYREDARTAKAPDGIDEDPVARLRTIQKLRRSHFGEEAASKLFGDEEREGEVAAERSRILKDTSLTPDERDARLAEIEAKLPSAAREARDDARRALRQRADEDALRQGGASDEDIKRHRVETMGEEAAQRLDELDRRREAWKERVEAFRSEREKIAARFADEGARRAAEERLLEESFTPEERIRVKAIVKTTKP
jgi:lipase chaperone LimK